VVESSHFQGSYPYTSERWSNSKIKRSSSEFYNNSRQNNSLYLVCKGVIFFQSQPNTWCGGRQWPLLGR